MPELLNEARNRLDRLLDYALAHDCGLVEHKDEGQQSPLVTGVKHTLAEIDKALAAPPSVSSEAWEICERCNGAGGDNQHSTCGMCDGRGGYASDPTWLRQIARGENACVRVHGSGAAASLARIADSIDDLKAIVAASPKEPS